MSEVRKPLFPLGQVLMTPGAMIALQEAGEEPFTYLFRHAGGDFGDLCEEDKKTNEDAIAHGGRVFSAYILPTGVKVWIITEWDRSITTALLPSGAP